MHHELDNLTFGGYFNNTETDVRFDYYKGVAASLAGIEGATHTLVVDDVVGFPFRAAKVLKTVVYVAVDEDENGIVWEKWPIKKHRIFS